jgi:hypothetical protein
MRSSLESLPPGTAVDLKATIVTFLSSILNSPKDAFAADDIDMVTQTLAVVRVAPRVTLATSVDALRKGIAELEGVRPYNTLIAVFQRYSDFHASLRALAVKALSMQEIGLQLRSHVAAAISLVARVLHPLLPSITDAVSGSLSASKRIDPCTLSLDQVRNWTSMTDPMVLKHLYDLMVSISLDDRGWLTATSTQDHDTDFDKLLGDAFVFLHVAIPPPPVCHCVQAAY